MLRGDLASTNLFLDNVFGMFYYLIINVVNAMKETGTYGTLQGDIATD
jgi:hypothetical protein